ncbi:sensor domain-containing diguanylate cyclase [Lysobacter sp. LF1]|uniref:diguanylate cyclase n=1 Tax=Lysobacter stagni TaxID=3045172 RepID=A0ABT6XHD8_9GAMM|nr:sensor domain-containing diguanylate cyclase [Lysobacter sp. LF1]MDI9239571.1 sensor domain-containing diguanylate cyclase [Lysobacter sp. LF1]
MNAVAPLPSVPFALIAESVASARTLEELVRPLLEVLEAVTGMESTYLTSVDEAAGVQRIVYARNTRQMQIPERLCVPWNDTLCKRALDEERMYTDDVAGCWGDSDAARALGIQTYVSTPVRLEDGTLYGTLCAASAQPMPLADDAQRALRMFSRLIGQQIERERLLGRLQEANAALAASALADAVTGLPNRRALMQEMTRRIAHCQRAHEALVVAFLDLDGFKAINDRHGHDVGDRFLASIGRALSGALRADDFAARLGGDEFVVVGTVAHAEGEHAIDAFRDRLARCTRARFALGEVTLDYDGASVGVVVAADDCADAETLIARADAAMYAVKRARRGTTTAR